MTYFTDANGGPRRAKIAVHAILGIFVLAFLFMSFGTVKAGEVGIKTTLGAVGGALEPGLYIKIPFIQQVYKINIKTLTVNYDRNGLEGDSKDTSQLFGASKDLQDVKIGVVVNYHINANRAVNVFTQYRSTENFELNVIEPIIRETVKSTSAQYTAEELVTKRSEFSDKVNTLLVQRLSEKDVTMEKFSVTNFEFSSAFTQAIENKVAAVQNAEAAKNKLVQVQFEAQQQIERAKAEAETILLQAQAITQQGGKDYVQLKALEKWDGKLPSQMIPGGSVPFIDLNTHLTRSCQKA